MKKIVRLTESDLHGIIRNSVNKILSELDWRTYANAANKSSDRAAEYDDKANAKSKWYDGLMFGVPERKRKLASKNRDKERDRANRFAKAANDAVKRDLGYKSKNGFEYNPSLRLGDGGSVDRLYPSSYALKSIDGNRHDTYENEYDVYDVNGEFKERYDWHPSYDRAVEWDKAMGNDSSKADLAMAKKGMPTPYERGRMNKGNKALGNWYNGKSKYKDGKYQDEE